VKYMQHWEELAEARDEGITEGATKNVITLIIKKIKKNKSVDTIADELEQDVDYVRSICDIAKKFAPDYNCEEIFDAVWENIKEH
ncbi:MAG: hypothetical protein ACI4GD_00360, partial [Lachnospiraceae bacterium]